MKKDVSYVDAAKIEAVIAASGCEVQATKGWLKVKGPTGLRLYVPLTKRVGRIDVAGFEAPAELGVRAPHCGPFGSVKQQLDFSRPEAEVLANLGALLAHMLSLPPAEKVKKVFGPKKPKAADWSPETLEKKAARMALIRKVAAEKGVAVSPASGALDPLPAPAPASSPEHAAQA